MKIVIDDRPISDFKFTQEEYEKYRSGIEIWRDIDEWVGLYMVSTFGRVKSLFRMVDTHKGFMRSNYERIMKHINQNRGYLTVTLSSDKFNQCMLVHVLVGNAFLTNPENKKELNHIDGDKHNPHLSNLERNTRSENILHSFKIGTRKPTCEGMFGKEHWNSKEICRLDRYTGEVLETYEGLMDMHRKTGFQFKNVSAAALGKRATCMGFAWKYAEDLVTL